MPIKNLVLRVIAGGAASIALLLPPILTALVWTSINLWFVLGALASMVFASFKFPAAKWPLGIVTAAMVALPPYPNWFFWSEQRGWHLWLGPNLRSLEIGANLIFFAIAILLVAVVIWAVSARPMEDSELR